MSTTRKRRARSARTRHAPTLAERFSTAASLIERGDRTPEMMHVLRQALELFEHNRLVGVVAKSPVRTLLENFYRLSLPCESTALPEHAKLHLRQRKVAYIGEIYSLELDLRPWAVAPRAVHDFLTRDLGLPAELDPVAIGWRPPYWDDPGFRALLDLPIEQVWRRDRLDYRPSYGHRADVVLQELKRRGVEFVGQLFRRRFWRSGYRLDYLIGSLDPHCRAAMVTPPDWHPPRRS